MNVLPRLVILGRDGVLNSRLPEAVIAPEQWSPLPGSLEAVARLNHAGIRVVVVTNQPGVATGLPGPDQLNRIHARLHSALSRVGGHLDGIFFCPHAADAACECHKPAPGLLRSVSLRFGMPLNRVPVIGDSLYDVEAALAARASPVLVLSGRGQETLEQNPALLELPCFADLADAVDAIFDGRLVA